MNDMHGCCVRDPFSTLDVCLTKSQLSGGAKRKKETLSWHAIFAPPQTSCVDEAQELCGTHHSVGCLSVWRCHFNFERPAGGAIDCK